MVSISSGALTANVGFTGMLVGTLIGPYINQQAKRRKKKFPYIASPQYFNINGLSQKIVSFVEAEKETFMEFEKLPKIRSKEKKESPDIIGDKLKKLTMFGNETIYQMRKELKQ